MGTECVDLRCWDDSHFEPNRDAQKLFILKSSQRHKSTASLMLVDLQPMSFVIFVIVQLHERVLVLNSLSVVQEVACWHNLPHVQNTKSERTKKK